MGNYLVLALGLAVLGLAARIALEKQTYRSPSAKRREIAQLLR